MNTVDARKSIDEKSPAGCVYKSVAPFTSPGYIAACELFRRRWHVEGLSDLGAQAILTPTPPTSQEK